MPDLVCDTSALQYLHQLNLMHVLREMGSRVLVPFAVSKEIEAGLSQGVDLPKLSDLPWLSVCDAADELTVAMVSDMGAGESAVIMHTMKDQHRIAILDDAVARSRAACLGVPFTGTLGVLLDAKNKGLIPGIKPMIERLEILGFHIAPRTKNLVLHHAGELCD